jgi:hypothetical protein
MADSRGSGSIAAVVFDVGGVLFPSPLRRFGEVEREYDIPDNVLQGFFRGGGFTEVETGRLRMADFLQTCSTTLSVDYDRRVPCGVPKLGTHRDLQLRKLRI